MSGTRTLGHDRRPSVSEALDAAARALSAATTVVLACHVNPDPDALGSMLGLGGHLRAMGKDVACSWSGYDGSLPRWASVLAATELLVPPDSVPAAPEAFVALDTASVDRLGMLTPLVDGAHESIVLDHHRTNPGFGTIPVIDPAASSTCEVAFRLIGRLGGELSAGSAACLYAGLLTDTGRFQYEATTPETLRVAAELLSRGFDHARIGRVLFEDHPAGYLAILAVALARLVLEADAGLVWTYLTRADVRAAGVAFSDADDLIDVVRTAREADVACVLKQQDDGRFKVSLRSKGATDVGAISATFGGGGHRLAAGYTSAAGVEETIADLRARLEGARGR